jgi:hypothetical protein
LTDWKIDQRDRAREAKERESQSKTELQSKVESYRRGVTEIAAKYDDFQEVMEDCEVDITPTLQKLLLDSENGPELSYHLAKNEKDLARIAKLDPVSAARELGRFEAKHLTAAEKTESREEKTTKAPAPLKPVGTKGAAQSSRTIWDADKMSQAEYEAMRRKQLAKKRA